MAQLFDLDRIAIGARVGAVHAVDAGVRTFQDGLRADLGRP